MIESRTLILGANAALVTYIRLVQAQTLSGLSFSTPRRLEYGYIATATGVTYTYTALIATELPGVDPS